MRKSKLAITNRVV